MKTHHLKIWSDQFEALLSGEKKHETRVNDRCYQVGDILQLSEWEEAHHSFTGRELRMKVTYIGKGFGVPETHVVMSVELFCEPEREHPIQNLILDRGVLSFEANQIVRFLLNAGSYDMNKLALMFWSDKDRRQFAQLIGYSVSGYSELPYVTDEAYAAVIAKRDAECA